MSGKPVHRVLAGLLVGIPAAVSAYFVNSWMLIEILPEYGEYPKALAATISILLLAMSVDSFRVP